MGTPKQKRERAGFADQANEDRLPPHSPEAEQGVLGCCMLTPGECVDDVRERIPLEAFYDLRHRSIFVAMMALMESNKLGFDIITLSQKLRDDKQLEEVGGLIYLNSLPDMVPSAANLPYYLDTVRDKFLLRKMLAAAVSVQQHVWQAEGEIAEVLDRCERDLTAAMEDHIPTTSKLAVTLVRDVMENVVEKFRRGVKYNVGPSMGFNYLDNIIPGFAPGDMIVLAARPGTGKSAMMMQVAEHMAEKLKLPVAIFSLEMTDRSLMTRQIFQRAGANLMKFSNGFFIDEEVPKVAAAAAAISKLPIHYDENAQLSIQDFEIKARRLVRKHGVKVIFIDYIQLMFVRGANRQWNRSEEIGEVSKRIKRAAKELGIPIVVLAQMNRDIEKEVHRRPRLADLRDSGQLEQDADIVMFLWKPNTATDRWRAQLEEKILPRLKCPDGWKHMQGHRDSEGTCWKSYHEYVSVTICTVAKQRNGPTGDSTLMFMKEWCRLVDAFTPPREIKDEKILTPQPAPEPEPEAPTEDDELPM